MSHDETTQLMTSIFHKNVKKQFEGKEYSAREIVNQSYNFAQYKLLPLLNPAQKEELKAQSGPEGIRQMLGNELASVWLNHAELDWPQEEATTETTDVEPPEEPTDPVDLESAATAAVTLEEDNTETSAEDVTQNVPA